VIQDADGLKLRESFGDGMVNLRAPRSTVGQRQGQW